MNTLLIEKTIRQLMRKKNIPGLAVGVVHNNEIIYTKGFGLRDLKQHKPMTADTLIGMGSITKSFTAFAIMALQEQGKLNIEDSVADHLNVEPFLSRPAIKIKHLLSHSSGIPSMDAVGSKFTYTFDQFSTVLPAHTREEFLAHMADADDFIIYEPGEHFFYNNDLYTCLEYIIEDVTGGSFDMYLKQAVLSPLNMNRAVLTQDAFDNDPDSNVMTGYILEERDGKHHYKVSDLPIDGSVKAPGGLYTSINEMLHYTQCLLSQGAFNGQQVLSANGVETLFTPQSATPYGRGENPQYCLGWSKDDITENIPHTVIHHGGCMLTSGSQMTMIPELNLGIVVAENAFTNVSPLIVQAIIASVLEQNPQQAVEGLAIAQAIEDITGEYQSPHNMYSFKVALSNNVLMADAGYDDGNITFPLLSDDIAKLVFKPYSLVADNKSKIEFLRNKTTGKVEYVTFDRNLYRRQ